VHRSLHAVRFDASADRTPLSKVSVNLMKLGKCLLGACHGPRPAI